MSKGISLLSSRDILKPIGIIIGVITLSFVVAQGTVLLGGGIIALIGIPFLILSVYNFRYGVFFLFIYGAALFQVARMLDSGLPFGILFDFLICLMFLSILFTFKGDSKINFKIKEPITIIYLLYFLYFGLEILNPNSTSISAWLASSRSYTLLLLFFIFISFFDQSKFIKRFILLWLSIAMVAALYGLQQELFGLFDFEWKYIYASPERYGLFFNWGHMRVFSIFSDPTTFGLFMAFSGLSTLALSFGPFSITKKIILLVMTVVIFTSMSFSGTRTSYAMVMIGVVFYILLNLKNPKVLGGSMILIILFLGLMVGPFYGGPIQRIRSTFDVSEDASMNVRDIKRLRFQSYIATHPIGGGVNTAGNGGLKFSPGHPLAGNFDPDSGYLRTAMELGWIGLLIVMLLNLMVVLRGIKNNFQLKSKILRVYNLAFIVPFFSLTVANYTQDALMQKPIIIPVIATYALVLKIRDLDL